MRAIVWALQVFYIIACGATIFFGTALAILDPLFPGLFP